MAYKSTIHSIARQSGSEDDLLAIDETSSICFVAFTVEAKMQAADDRRPASQQAPEHM